MGDAVFFPGVEFSNRFLEFRDVEDRIVAESSPAGGLIGDEPVKCFLGRENPILIDYQDHAADKECQPTGP
jgi:hypothetical protein